MCGERLEVRRGLGFPVGVTRGALVLFAEIVNKSALAENYEVTLTFCFEKAGVLRDADDESSVIPSINEEQFKKLIDEGIVSGGMIPKLENAFDALHRGVRQVVITQADNIDGSRGTTIKEK